MASLPRVPASLALLLAAGACGGGERNPGASAAGGADGDAAIRFAEVAAEAGIAMRHAPGARERTLPEDTGSGLAWGDVDGDGDWDLYVVNYAARPPEGATDAAWKPGAGSNRLFRNDGGRFTDVTAQAGVADPEGFGMGASFADYDGDGDADLYVTNFGPNRLYRNRGDGSFDEVAAEAGVDDARFSTGVAWGDVDRDGDLDLYVCNYVSWVPGDPEELVVASDEGVEMSFPVTLDPASYDPQPNAFFRNEGDGRFTEVAGAMGVANPEGRSLEAVLLDLDGDGWMDLYVNNDLSTNRLYLQPGEPGAAAWADVSTLTGTDDPRGSMGLGVGEFGDLGGEADGLPDLLLTHWYTEANAVYRSRLRPGGGLDYVDDAAALRLGGPSEPWVGWGTAIEDFDLDGRADVIVANGSTTEREDDVTRLIAEPLQVFRNDGAGFVELGGDAGVPFAVRHTARGLAAADWDGDGDVDVAVSVNHGAPLLLRNDTATAHASLKVLLDAPASRARGARVVVRAGGREQTRWWVPEASYLSGHAPELVFGLGGAARAGLRVHWADGSTTDMRDLGAGRVVVTP